GNDFAAVGEYWRADGQIVQSFVRFRIMKMSRRGFLSTGAAVAATNYAGREVVAAAVTESSGFATANGHKLYYATLGRGMPVIFMHGGLGFDHQYFRPFVDPLA